MTKLVTLLSSGLSSGLSFLLQKERRLGVASATRRYDLPLDNDAGAKFLLLLTALMTFLATLALSGAFTLSALTEQWSSGLENKVTIEIPAQTETDDLRTPEDIQDLTDAVKKKLKKSGYTKTVTALEKQDIQDLLKPWLGDVSDLGDIPLPGLVSIELTENTPALMDKLEDDIREISTGIKIDTHEEWLGDLLGLIQTLQALAVFVLIVIGAITVTAIASGVRARMDIYKEDVALLHMMGASDSYIASQFQRHALLIAIQGTLVGVLAATLLVLLAGALGEPDKTALLPSGSFGWGDVTGFIILAALICAIASFSARFTVLRTLARMP